MAGRTEVTSDTAAIVASKQKQAARGPLRKLRTFIKVNTIYCRSDDLLRAVDHLRNTLA